MHHRISGYNRAAMSQRRKDAAFSRDLVKMCRLIRDGILRDPVYKKLTTAISQAADSFAEFAEAAGKAGQEAFDAYNENGQ